MVVQNNTLRLQEIQQRITQDNQLFHNIHQCSRSTIDRVLRRNAIRMKQVYKVPFERNSVRVKELRFQFVQRILELDSSATHYEYLYIDEAGFNLQKKRRRGRNVIGHRATVNVPGQRGGNITLCATISTTGVVAHNAVSGPYNTARLLYFLNLLNEILFPQGDQEQMVRNFVVVWDNVQFHHSALVREWFENHPQFRMVFLPPYSPFLNTIEEFFSSWRWKVNDRIPYNQVSLLQVMEEACGDTGAQACQGWIQHSRRFFPTMHDL
ncbi:insertion element IS630 uncharacterized 39 kDa protein-like [Tachysurus vachellii]|uniref:insertion element IS630 uncharacterized 39 kDa protein-like n=1 Tax=Tachysurus vachellii TaxID=175792 RepID=UPI00296ABE46|nr:insertion element IS630 uncharacterized 39 kDa protein-like [Tachysurus vachellii]